MANIKNHRPMSSHQPLECPFGALAAPSEKSVQQLGVGKVPGRPNMGEGVKPR
jgi:hypothetical protein